MADYPRYNKRVASARASEAVGFDPSGNGGFGVIARRHVPIDVCDRDGLRRHAVGSPVRLLKLLPALHPDVKFALNNLLRLSVAGISIEAVREDDGKTTRVEQKGNQALAELWSNLAPETGGDLRGIFKVLLQELVLTGLAVVETVPGRRGQGLAEVVPVDSATISFRRKDGKIVPLQRQIYPATRTAASYMGLVELPVETTFWKALDPQVDDPYGAPQYETALAEVISDLSIMRDLRDAVHANAWPRLKFSFDEAEHFRIATDILKLVDKPGDMAATEWVEAKFLDFQSLTSNMLADDAVYYWKGSEVETLGAGSDFGDLTKLLEFLQARTLRSLLAFPALMGIALGNTETYGSIQWKAYALNLEELRDTVLSILVQVATQHLQLLGLPLKAVAKVERIQTGEAKTDEEVLTMKEKRLSEMVRKGAITQDEYSQELTGKPAADPTKAPNFDVQNVRLSERATVGAQS